MFRSMDDDGNGTISPAEFAAGMEVLGIDCSKAEITSVFSLFDTDGDGTISYRELADGLKSEKDGQFWVLGTLSSIFFAPCIIAHVSTANRQLRDLWQERRREKAKPSSKTLVDPASPLPRSLELRVESSEDPACMT